MWRRPFHINLFFFFFKQKTAYEIETCLEFRRVLFRSKSPYIFVSEVNQGIHVIDNTNPSSPQNVAFINVPGNLDIAIKDNVLYADSYIDFVAVEIGRASCRERVENWVWGDVIKREYRK